jgi:WD40 repeat protein
VPPSRHRPVLNSVLDLAYSPDGRTLATITADLMLRLWDAERLEPLSEPYEPPVLPVEAVRFSGDGRTLILASSAGTVMLLDLETGQERAQLEFSGPITRLRVSPDGRLLAVGTGPPSDRREEDPAARDEPGSIRIWDIATGEDRGRLAHSPGGPLELAFSPDGRTLAACGRGPEVVLWDVATGGRRLDLSGHADGVLALAFSPDGRLLATGGKDRLLRLWDPADGRPLDSLPGHVDAIQCLAFSADGSLIASGGWDHSVRPWDVAGGTAGKTPEE